MKQTSKVLKDYIEVTMHHVVTCGACGREETNDYDDNFKLGVMATAKELFAEGWREIDSEEYGSIMSCCPSCVEEQIKLKGALT